MPDFDRHNLTRLLAALVLFAASPLAATDANVLETVLRPVRDGGTEVTAIEVRLVLHAAPSADKPFSLTAPIVYAATTGIADRVRDLEVTDSQGAVPFTIEDDPAVKGGFPYFRHWRAERAVAGRVTISYRSLVQPAGAPNGPPFGIRPAAGGVSGAGSGFLVLPENVASAVSKVRWDLSDLAPGSIAASSYGDGDFEIEGAPAELIQAWYMAGPAGRYPEAGDTNGFSATWLGTPPFDPNAAMQFAGEVYEYLGDFFPHLSPAPRYRVFIRILDTPPFGGGTALTSSFMLSRGPAGPDESTEGPNGLFFHEMIHQFVGGIEGPVGVTSWFSEGLTSYYTTLLQLRGGFSSVNDYGASINEVVRNYYTSPARNWSAERIVETGFADEDVRHTPYVRGHLYFANLDSQIRAASHGRRNLDMVLRELFQRREDGKAFDRDAWIAVVSQEVGSEAAEQFEAVILEGETIVPASDAFGPCFQRESAVFADEDREIKAYEWARKDGIPDSLCREQSILSAPAAQDEPDADGVEASVSLHPVRDGGAEVTAIEVKAEFTGNIPGAEGFSLQSPIVYAGRTGMAESIDDLLVRDAAGAVSLKVEDDADNTGGFPFYRHWRAERPVTPPVAVSYRVRPAATPMRGPQFDFYAHGGGISSGGMALFVLPENMGPADWHATWDLSDLAPGSIAASTHGEGSLDLTGPADRLIQAYYMVGPLGRYVSPRADSSFYAYWLGETRFDAPKEMAWVAKAYEYLREFYQDDTTPSYRVFVRALPVDQRLGGTALENSFMLGVAAGAPEPSATSPRSTMFHEMGHMFVGGISGGESGGAPWFAEGLNVHYTRLLLLRSGLVPVNEYLDDVNESARNYYSNPYRNASADELFRLGFSTGVGAGSAQNVAYTRGSLYFAAVDSRIRAASNGRRALDDVILPLFERRGKGEPLTRDALVDALSREIGPAAREEFEDVILDGETIVPPSDAFGPCFERHTRQYNAGGKAMSGYEWVRIANVEDERCRTW
jgi:predicted metalloprotease with PDZ domain